MSCWVFLSWFQAKLAERAGAVAVMALERIPADIRTDGGKKYLYCACFGLYRAT